MIEEEEIHENENDEEEAQPEEEPLVLDGADEVTDEEKAEHGKKALSQLPGFHVSRTDSGEHLGVFATLEAAEHFIRGHLKPQGIEGAVEETTA